MDIIKGQEAICSDGLGRATDFGEGVAGYKWIRVSTYVDDKNSEYDARNVELIDPRQIPMPFIIHPEKLIPPQG